MCILSYCNKLIYHPLVCYSGKELTIIEIHIFFQFVSSKLIGSRHFGALSLILKHITNVKLASELELNGVVSFGCSASEWKVPTTFIYGVQDWMNYQGAQEARKLMKVPCEIIRVPQVSFSSPALFLSS